MEDSLFWGIPKSAYESADRMLTLARKGGIRQHLLGDTSRIRHGTIEDQSVDEYCNFLQTKLCCEILQLEGADMSAEENSPVDGFRRRGQGAKRREGARECAEKIPCSPPKRKAGCKACFLHWQK